MDKKILRVPDKIRTKTIQIWFDGAQKDRQHAAKQLACWMLAETTIPKIDHNFECDAMLALGMAAQRCTWPEDLIEWFEKNVLEKWYGREKPRKTR